MIENFKIRKRRFEKYFRKKYGYWYNNSPKYGLIFLVLTFIVYDAKKYYENNDILYIIPSFTKLGKEFNAKNKEVRKIVLENLDKINGYKIEKSEIVNTEDVEWYDSRVEFYAIDKNVDFEKLKDCDFIKRSAFYKEWVKNKKENKNENFDVIFEDLEY